MTWRAPGRRLRSIEACATLGVLTFVSTSLLAHDRISTKVTWAREVSRLVQARCGSCHSPGGRSTIRLTTYEEARPWAAAIREQVLARRMPIWHAARGYGEFSNDPSLSPFEIALIAAWVDGGAPRGTDTASPPKPTLEPPSALPAGHRVTLPCRDQPLTGRLLGVDPSLSKGGSVGIAALLPGGRREIVAWIRDYDPTYRTTYWLRAPLTLAAGSRLSIVATGECTLTAVLAR